MYFYCKAFHIIGFVSWFAGLFYLVRLFVYHVEANEKPEPEKSILQKQYTYMEWRLYNIITTPAMVLTLCFGISMLFINPAWLQSGWMHAKLGLLVALIGYHHWCKTVIKRLERGEMPFNSFQFRLLNELPTIFLVSIVLLAVLKNTLNMLYAFGGVFLFGMALFVAARQYKKYRLKNER
jgi:putative membrane protein